MDKSEFFTQHKKSTEKKLFQEEGEQNLQAFKRTKKIINKAFLAGILTIGNVHMSFAESPQRLEGANWNQGGEMLFNTAKENRKETMAIGFVFDNNSSFWTYPHKQTTSEIDTEAGVGIDAEGIQIFAKRIAKIVKEKKENGIRMVRACGAHTHPTEILVGDITDKERASMKESPIQPPSVYDIVESNFSPIVAEVLYYAQYKEPFGVTYNGAVFNGVGVHYYDTVTNPGEVQDLFSLDEAHDILQENSEREQTLQKFIEVWNKKQYTVQELGSIIKDFFQNSSKDDQKKLQELFKKNGNNINPLQFINFITYQIKQSSARQETVKKLFTEEELGIFLAYDSFQRKRSAELADLHRVIDKFSFQSLQKNPTQKETQELQRTYMRATGYRVQFVPKTEFSNLPPCSGPFYGRTLKN